MVENILRPHENLEPESAPYVYQPLPDDKAYIRIATIHPGSFEDLVYITLRHEMFDSENKPSYMALSYVWGPPEAHPAHIVVNHKPDGLQQGLHRRGFLPTRENLLSALRNIRFEDSPRDVWIDAISIDQGDEV